MLFDNSEHFTEHEESDGSGRCSGTESKNVFTRINESVFRPLFVRRFTYQVCVAAKLCIQVAFRRSLRTSRSSETSRSKRSGQPLRMTRAPMNSYSIPRRPLRPPNPCYPNRQKTCGSMVPSPYNYARTSDDSRSCVTYVIRFSLAGLPIVDTL